MFMSKLTLQSSSFSSSFVELLQLFLEVGLGGKEIQSMFSSSNKGSESEVEGICSDLNGDGDLNGDSDFGDLGGDLDLDLCLILFFPE
jgi:hypothetical protein